MYWIKENKVHNWTRVNASNYEPISTVESEPGALERRRVLYQTSRCDATMRMQSARGDRKDEREPRRY